MGTRLALLAATVGVLGGLAVSMLQAAEPDRRLIEAVRRRDATTFAALLRAKAYINAAEADGSSVLSWAIHLGERDMALSLIRAGAKVNTADVYGETPLLVACSTGDAVVVRQLIRTGATTSVTRWNGETPLMIAAGAGSLDAVRALVERGADVNVADPKRRQTALMWAAAEGHGDVVSGLLALGADVKAVSAMGFTPLVFAAVNGDEASVTALLAAGADPNYRLPSGTVPLIVALVNRSTRAAMALLEGGAAVDTPDRTGNLPLHLAAQQGDIAVVKALLDRKVDPNVRTAPPQQAAGAGRGGARGGGGGARGAAVSGRETALMIAAKADHEDVMRALVAAGADPSLRAADGSTLLMAAAGGARLQTFKYAYELDPLVDVRVDGTDSTIMHLAVNQNGRTQPETVEVIQFLADHGAALDELDGSGRTPIAVADRLPVDQAVDRLTKLITDRGGKPKIPSAR
jgi:ankyrin repeat protein